MTQNFDSRALGNTDAYAQRFMKEGTYRYHVVAAGCGALADGRPYQVTVAQGKGEMEQHTVMLQLEEGRLRPDPAELEVKEGDLVTWACREAGAPFFEIVGDKEFFGSARLFNESGYAHAFGTAGVYEWVDAYGSGLAGTVRVTDPGCRSEAEMAAWREKLSEGQLVMITGDEAEPSEVEILTGQTVYFAVTKTHGISITHPILAHAVTADRHDHGEDKRT